MKNKKQFFSLCLYVDALKQLRVMGIVMIIFVGFVSSSIALLEDGSYSLYILSLFSFMMFSPIMTLYIFRFLTSRKASDVFHSMPYTRVCLYFSYVFAVITYVMAILLVNFLAYFIAGGEHDIIINLEYILSLVVCNLLVISAINLAQGMTGTIFTNISVTGIILFFPRLLIYFVASFVCEFCPYINIGYIKFPFGASSNVLTGMFIDGRSISSDVELESIIYTFVLSLIYFAISAILFNRRKSEMAEAPASNRLVQHIFRSIITLVICLLPLSDILYGYVCDDDYYYGDFDLGIVIMYFFAVFIYFLYELLATKKLKNLLKIIPGIIVIAILNVAIVFSVFGISEYVRKFQPKAEEVEYVIIHNDDGRHYYSITDTLYFMDLVEEEKITDKRIIELLCEQFDVVRKNDVNDYVYGGYNVSFCVNGKIYHRYFSINQTRFHLLLKYLGENEKILNNYKNLPDYDDLEEMRIGITGEVYIEEDKKDIYEKYKEDLSKLSAIDVIDIMNTDREINEGYIEITYIKDKEKYYLNLPFIKELPNSYNRYLEIANKNTERYMANLVDEVKLMLSKNGEFYFSIIVMKSEDESDSLYLDSENILEYSNEDLDEKVLEFCREAADSYKLPDINESVYVIELGSKRIVFSASDECMELFKELKKYQ